MAAWRKANRMESLLTSEILFRIARILRSGFSRRKKAPDDIRGFENQSVLAVISGGGA